MAAARDSGDPYRLFQFSDREPSRLLVFNCGSGSLRYAFFDTEHPARALRGRIDGLGEATGRHQLWGPDLLLDQPVVVPDPVTAIGQALDTLADPRQGGLVLERLTAIGHRVLFGVGPGSAVVVDGERFADLLAAGFAPFDQRRRLQALAACRDRLPRVPQVAVVDSAFFQDLPEVARLYALPLELQRERGLRRIGFQGLSHKWAAYRAATYLGRPLTHFKIVSAHLGRGASLAAIDHGRAIDTTMGLTPLEGLPGARRCGDLDPGLVLHLLSAPGRDPAGVLQLLERESGLLGLSGQSAELQALEAFAERGDERALLSLQVFGHRVRRAIGAMAASLDGLDVLVFTGGIGENAAGMRARICGGLQHLGVSLDVELNRRGLEAGADVAAVEGPGSRVRVLVVRSDEARMIARETARALGRELSNRALDAQPRADIPIGVSAHHVHLSPEHVEALFGPGHQLTPRAPLHQPGQFACQEAVDLLGPKGQVTRVRVLGPTRKQTQVEISRTEEFQLGIDAPIRDSGDLDGTPGLILQGPAGRVELPQGVICARRHIHMSPSEAEGLGLRDRDVVLVEVAGPRPLVFGDVLVRVKPDYLLEMHLDTDEANAAELNTGGIGRLVGIQSRALEGPRAG